MLYGSSVFVPFIRSHSTKTQLLLSHQRQALTSLYHAYRSTSSTAICTATLHTPLHLQALQAAAKYWVRHKNYHQAAQLLHILPLNHHQKITRKDVAERILEIWNGEYLASETGTHIKSIFPTIYSRTKTSWLIPSFYTLPFITRHGPFPVYLHSRRIAPTPYCTCTAIGSPEHFLIHCPLIPHPPSIRNLTLINLLTDRQHWKTFSEISRLTIQHPVLQHKFPNPIYNPRLHYHQAPRNRPQLRNRNVQS